MFFDTDILKTIAHDLDNCIYPSVYNGGVVMPNNTIIDSSLMGRDQKSERSRKKRSTTRSWTGPQRGSWPTSGSRTSRKATQFISTSIRDKYQEELNAISNAYPESQFWLREEGVWLLVKSKLLLGFHGTVVFAVSIPFNQLKVAKGWGFWNGQQWIGPRHTNFPDGSICAFEPSDGTWVLGDPIVDLIDLYSLWAVRHLYLQHYGRWPGLQTVHHPYERIIELNDDEHCGCGQSGLPYVNCCKENDYSRNRLVDAITFNTMTGGQRYPPDDVIEFVTNMEQPPNNILD